VSDAALERWVVILAGGIGSRFWPASTPTRPKQFLPLASERPLIADTVERARALAPLSNILVVAGQPLRAQLERHLPELAARQLLLEPQARGTAAALAWAAREIIARARRPERAVMVSLHSDHVIHPLPGFVASLERAMQAAHSLDRLVTVGITPRRPETGYGYIEVGDALQPGVHAVRRFVEKPAPETAARFLERGGYLWNSGIFIWPPERLLAELMAHTPELASGLARLRAGDVPGFYSAVPTLTIDYGLLERSPAVAVVPAEFNWDDVGAWAALLRLRKRDAAGNLSAGDAWAVECRDSVVWAEDGPIVAFGVADLLVVRASGITFVAPLARAGDLKALLAGLPPRLQHGTG
jgi:mannose-1-phosphate guanylyltransferase